MIHEGGAGGPAGPGEVGPVRPSPPALVASAAIGTVIGMGAGVIGVGWDVTALAGAVIGGVGGPVSLWDQVARRIPDRLVVIGVVLAACLAAVVAMAEEPRWTGVGLGAVAIAGPLLVMHLVSPAGIGFGDVKYGVALGAAMGVVGPELAVWALLGACLLGVAVAAVVTSWRRSLPFGSCLTVAALVAVAVGGR